MIEINKTRSIFYTGGFQPFQLCGTLKLPNNFRDTPTHIWNKKYKSLKFKV